MHLHSHENWELIYCTGGGGEFVFDDCTMKYAEGDIVIIPPRYPPHQQQRAGFYKYTYKYNRRYSAVQGTYRHLRRQ